MMYRYIFESIGEVPEVRFEDSDLDKVKNAMENDLLDIIFKSRATHVVAHSEKSFKVNIINKEGNDEFIDGTIEAVAS